MTVRPTKLSCLSDCMQAKIFMQELWKQRGMNQNMKFLHMDSIKLIKRYKDGILPRVQDDTYYNLPII